MTLHINKKQAIAIALVLLLGAVLAVLILRGGPAHEDAAEPGAGQEHAEEAHGEARHAPQGDEHAGATGQAHAPASIAIEPAAVSAAGIVIASAGPGRIDSKLTFQGEIQLNADRTAHVVPRLDGVVEKVHADLGQRVKKGQLLAEIASITLSEQRSALITAQQRLALAQSSHERERRLWQEKISAEQDYLQARQTMQEAEIAVRNARQQLAALGTGEAGGGPLNRYLIRAPFDGMVLEKHLVLGEAVKEDANIFVIADLSTVWADIALPAGQLDTVRVGAHANVSSGASGLAASGSVTYVGAVIGEDSRSAKARITLANPQLAWRPGLFVTVDIAAGQAEVALAVPASALHSIDGQQVVFTRSASGFTAQPVRSGRADARSVEIVEGLAPGTPYAAAGAFVLKSGLGKAGAAHQH